MRTFTPHRKLLGAVILVAVLAGAGLAAFLNQKSDSSGTHAQPSREGPLQFSIFDKRGADVAMRRSSAAVRFDAETVSETVLGLRIGSIYTIQSPDGWPENAPNVRQIVVQYFEPGLRRRYPSHRYHGWRMDIYYHFGNLPAAPERTVVDGKTVLIQEQVDLPFAVAGYTLTKQTGIVLPGIYLVYVLANEARSFSVFVAHFPRRDKPVPSDAEMMPILLALTKTKGP